MASVSSYPFGGARLLRSLTPVLLHAVLQQLISVLHLQLLKHSEMKPRVCQSQSHRFRPSWESKDRLFWVAQTHPMVSSIPKIPTGFFPQPWLRSLRLQCFQQTKGCGPAQRCGRGSFRRGLLPYWFAN